VLDAVENAATATGEGDNRVPRLVGQVECCIRIWEVEAQSAEENGIF
jgi:hypothetical protein